MGTCEGHRAAAGSFVERVWRLSRRGRIVTMADRYQDRPFPADDDYGRGDHQHAPASGESDPLGRTCAADRPDRSVRSMGRASQPPQPHAPRDQHQEPVRPTTPARRSAAMDAARRAAGSASRASQPSRIIRVRCIRCIATRPQHAAPEPDYQPAPPRRCRIRAESCSPIRRAMTMRCTASSIPAPQALPARSGLCGRSITPIRTAMAKAPTSRPRSAAAAWSPWSSFWRWRVLGTGGAFAYRTYIGSPRSGEPPIIRADTGPTKIVPAPLDANAKVPDRLAPATAPRRSFRARKRLSTSMPSPDRG